MCPANCGRQQEIEQQQPDKRGFSLFARFLFILPLSECWAGDQMSLLIWEISELLGIKWRKKQLLDYKICR